MTSLADIWDTPAESASHSDLAPTQVNYDDDDDIGRNPKRPTARPRSTLFLDSDSENDAPKSSKAHYASKPGASKPDIDAFWDDLDEDPETAFKPLAPSLDVEALKRQADAQIALTPHQILPSSSPPRDLEDDEGGGKDRGGKKGKDATIKKKKRARLDEGRLVGPSGLPALVKHAKDFKPKGKGHELSDLNRLLNVYQFWGHQMYPNTQFKDTVQRIEKLCHSKRMHVALSVWRDEDKGLINGQSIPDPENPDHSDSDDDDKNDDGDDAARPSDVPIATEDERSSPAPSRGPSLPPSSASETGGLDDDFDIDAMIAEEEAARAQEQQAARGSAMPTNASRPPVNVDEAIWDEMMADSLPDEPWVPPDLEATARSLTAVAAAKPAMEEDEDMWDALEDIPMDAPETTVAAPTTAGEEVSTTMTSVTPVSPPRSGVAPRGSSPVTGAAGLVGVDPTRPATNDDGWDEMYA